MSTEEIDRIWEMHKPILWGLWIRDRKSMNELKANMEKRGFIATPNEYKKRFQKWGFSQNISQEIWKTVGYQVKKRKCDGLDSDVVVNGVRIPPTKVRKETCRHFYTTSELMKTPNPTFDSGTLASVCRPISFSLLDKEVNWSATMPWISFNERTIGSRHFSLSNFPSASTDSQSLIKTGGIETMDLIKALPGLKQIMPSHLGSDMNPVQLASRLANMMPQYFPGQHLLNSQMVSLRIPSDAEKVILQWSIYHMSNGGDFSDESILRLFDSHGVQNIPLNLGDNILNELTFKVVLERFWGAGIRENRRDIIIWAMKLGVSPNTRVVDLEDPKRGTAHLPLAIFLSDLCITDSDLDLIEILLVSEAHRPSSQYCCGDHGTILECAVTSADFKALKAVMQYESELIGHTLLFELSILDLIYSVGPVTSKTSGEKIHYILQTYEKEYYQEERPSSLMSPLDLLKALASPDGLIKAVVFGSDSLFTILHQHGVDFNCHDERHLTPLGVCASRWAESWCGASDTEMENQFKTLLSLGASTKYIPTDGAGNIYFTPLHYAVTYENTTACQLLLQKGACPNIRALPPSRANSDFNGLCPHQMRDRAVTCLQQSLSTSSYNCAQLLLKSGALPVGDEIIRLAMNYKRPSCAEHLEDIVIELALKGVDVNLRSADGSTALQVAIRNKQEVLAIALIRAGSDTCSPSTLDWYTGLRSIQDFAGDKISIIDCVSQICGESNLNQGFARPLWGRFLLKLKDKVFEMSCKEELQLDGYTEALQSIVDKTPSEYSLLALQVLASIYVEQWPIASLGFFEKLLAKLQPLRYPSPRENMAKAQKVFNILYTAIDAYFAEDTQLFDTLLPSIELAHMPSSAYVRACYDPFFHVFEMQCEIERERPSFQAQLTGKLLCGGFRPTTLAGLSCVKQGTLEELKKLVAAGFNPRRRYPWSQTALQIASTRGDPEFVKYLLTFKVEVNSGPPWMCYKRQYRQKVYPADTYSTWDGTRRNALQSAVASGNQECIKQLLDAGADVNAKPAYCGGATALQLAAINGHVGIANWLISDYGADVNAPGARMRGRTALEGAAEHGRLDMIYLLQKFGCTITGSGRRQLVNGVILAEQNGYNTVATMLKNWGGWSQKNEEKREAWEEENKEYLGIKHTATYEDTATYKDWVELFPEEKWILKDDGECCDNEDCDCCYYNKNMPQHEEEDEEYSAGDIGREDEEDV